MKLLMMLLASLTWGQEKSDWGVAREEILPIFREGMSKNHVLNTFDEETSKRFAACEVDAMIEKAQEVGCAYGEPKDKPAIFRYGKLIQCLQSKGYEPGITEARVCHIKAKQRP